jgi:hypothetical protein
MTASQTAQVALIPQTQKVLFEDVAVVAAALQRQVASDFGPIWNCGASVAAFPRPNAVPTDYWRIHIVDEEPDAKDGTHWFTGNAHDNSGQPFANVGFGETWSLTASHELLEMLVDPWGERRAPGLSPSGDQRLVEFLIEVCDPVQDAQCAYHVNGVLVSDFCTPQYYGFPAVAGTGFSFQQKITGPGLVALGGTLAWSDVITFRWYQMVNQNGQLDTIDLGFIDTSTLSTRSEVNRRTPSYTKLSNAQLVTERQREIDIHRENLRLAMEAKAASIERTVFQLSNGPKMPSVQTSSRRAKRKQSRGSNSQDIDFERIEIFQP